MISGDGRVLLGFATDLVSTAQLGLCSEDRTDSIQQIFSLHSSGKHM
jgi:hypothetical protein